MSTQERAQQGTLRFWDQPPQTADVTVRERSAGERAGRALVALGIAWGLALFSVLIPVAHFVLVPGFALGGVVVAVIRYLEVRTVVRVAGTCPKCEQGQDIATSQKWKSSLTIECPSCRSDLQLETKEDPGA